MGGKLKYPHLPGETFNERKRRLQAMRRATPDGREKANALARRWRGKYPGAWKMIDNRARLKRNYGLTPESLRQMFENQEGLCAVCSRAICLCGTCDSRSCIDHDHATGKVRGLLCQRCNRGMGMLKDSPSVLRNAAGYLEGAAGAI